MYIKEGLQRVLNGTENKTRHLTLFSICGIIGLIDALVALKGFAKFNIYEQIAYVGIWVVFLWFFTGYETLFLKERELPEIDFRSLKIVFSKTLFAIFLIELAIFVIRLFFENNVFLILSDLLLAVPLVAVQAGFSYNFDNSESFSLLKKTTGKIFINLAAKRFLMTLCAYLIVLTILTVLLAGFCLGLFIALRGHFNSLVYTILAQQNVIFKLAIFIASILLEYVVVNISLVWDYELIKTYAD